MPIGVFQHFGDSARVLRQYMDLELSQCIHLPESDAPIGIIERIRDTTGVLCEHQRIQFAQSHQRP